MSRFKNAHIYIIWKAILKGDKTHFLVSIHNLMGCFSFKRLYKRMSLNDQGRIILENRPRVNTKTLNIEQLKSLPENTFGYLFVQHMLVHGFDKDVTPPPKSPFENSNTAYAKIRWRETHDFRHVLTGMPAKMSDEAILAAFQYGNHRNSWSLLVMIIGPLFSWKPISPFKQWYRMKEAYDAGKSAVCLASVNYEEAFPVDIDELRKAWKVKNLVHLSK